jgi:N6-adenosine-specific RNA methylase IME4
MDNKSIANLPINQIADKNCILFIWVTMPKLNECFDIIKKWGFVYKTCGFVWIKKNKKSDSIFWGVGRWTRSNAEICLIATKGKPKRISAKVHSVIISRIREHSRKPDEVRERIVELCGDLSRIELFARQEIVGWDCWGNEV